MSLSRQHVFVAGETLEASEANGEIDNIINNPVPLLNLTTTNVGGVIYLSGSNQLTSSAAPSAGQILVGTSGGVFTPVNLTAGSNVTITEGSGSLEIAAATGGSFTVEESDGSPSIAAVTTLKADQTTGLAVTGGAGVATVAIATVPVANGGTGIGTATSNGVVMGNVTGGFKVSAAGTANQVFRIGTSGTQGSFGQVNLASSAAVTGALATTNGGTGLTSTPADGQLLIGNGNGFTLASITAGSGITVTNGDGAITIAASASSFSVTATGDVVCGNGVGETNLFSQTVTGGTLGSAGTLEGIFQIFVTDNASGFTNRTLTLRMKYGGSQVAAAVLNTSASDGASSVTPIGSTKPMIVRAVLSAEGTGNQVGTLVVTGYTTAADGGGVKLLGAASGGGQGTTAVDSTADKTFLITAQWSEADSNCSMQISHGSLRKII